MLLNKCHDDLHHREYKLHVHELFKIECDPFQIFVLIFKILSAFCQISIICRISKISRLVCNCTLGICQSTGGANLDLTSPQLFIYDVMVVYEVQIKLGGIVS